MKIKPFLKKHKYELLLLSLVLHLFVGLFLEDQRFHRDVVWPINMVILGVASVGIFIEKGRWKNLLRNALLVLVVGLPIGLSIFGSSQEYWFAINLIYVLFFSFIFWEVIKFLVKPSYINADIISASACGYLLIIEIFVFLLQIYFYRDSNSLSGVTASSNAGTYTDLVYFASVTLTSIGYGDISPNSHQTKLLISFFGILGEFYSVVLVGILISKFTNRSKKGG